LFFGEATLVALPFEAKASAPICSWRSDFGLIFYGAATLVANKEAKASSPVHISPGVATSVAE